MKYIYTKVFVIIYLIICSLHTRAQTDTVVIKKQIIATMDSLTKAFFNNDWTSFTNFMHPSVISMIGSKENFAVYIENAMKTMEMAKMERMEPGNILQLIKTGENQWQCLIESRNQMHIDTMLYCGVSSNIGFSDDNGMTWKFIRVNTGSEKAIREIFPEISNRFKIPYNKTLLNTTLDELLLTYQPEYPTDTVVRKKKIVKKMPVKKKKKK